MAQLKSFQVTLILGTHDAQGNGRFQVVQS